MRINPPDKYHKTPCSYVAAGCAYEDIYKRPFNEPMPNGLKWDGWLTLEDQNKYIRKLFPVRKKEYFKRGERIKLKDFLEKNKERCIICCYGHCIYVNKDNYWSYFDNLNDDIVCIWFLKDS